MKNFLENDNVNFAREGRVIPSLVVDKDLFHSSYCIDYLTFSFPFEFRYPLDALLPSDRNYNRLISLLSSLYLNKDFAEETFSSNGFKFAYKWNLPLEYVGEKNPSTRLNYYLVSNDLDIGNIEMSGACCRDFERRYLSKIGDTDIDYCWHELIDKVINIKGSFSRIDIAFDLFNITNDHSFMWFFKKIFIERSYNSPIGSLRPKIDVDDRTDTYEEQTLTIGSPESLINICIYNKKLEQLNQNKECNYKSWVRIEIRFKKDRANSFVAGLLKNWNDKTKYCVGLLKHYLQIKDKPDFYEPDEWVPRKTRKAWKTNEFWQNLFEDAEKIKLVHLDDKVSLIQKKKQYTNSNLANFLTSIRYSMDEEAFKLFIDMICSRGINNLKANDIDLLNFERLKNNLKPLEKEDIELIKHELTLSKLEGFEDLNNLIQIGNIEVEEKKLNDLDSQIKKYEKVKELNGFLRVLKDHLKDSFNDLTKEEVVSLMTGLLHIYKE